MKKPTKYSKIDAPNLFKVQVEKLIDKQKREVETGTKIARFLKGNLKIINRECLAPIVSTIDFIRL